MPFHNLPILIFFDDLVIAHLKQKYSKSKNMQYNNIINITNNNDCKYKLSLNTVTQWLYYYIIINKNLQYI